MDESEKLNVELPQVGPRITSQEVADAVLGLVTMGVMVTTLVLVVRVLLPW